VLFFFFEDTSSDKWKKERTSTCHEFRCVPCANYLSTFATVASPAMGHWSTCPLSTSDNFIFSSLWSKSDSQVLCSMRDQLAVLYQVLNKQVPVPVPVPVVQVPVQVPVHNLQVPVPVQVLCINYRHSVTLELHKVKFVVSFIFKKRTVRTNELRTQSVVKHQKSATP